jgi:hypothetical protein
MRAAQRALNAVVKGAVEPVLAIHGRNQTDVVEAQVRCARVAVVALTVVLAGLAANSRGDGRMDTPFALGGITVIGGAGIAVVTGQILVLTFAGQCVAGIQSAVVRIPTILLGIETVARDRVAAIGRAGTGIVAALGHVLTLTRIRVAEFHRAGVIVVANDGRVHAGTLVAYVLSAIVTV